MGTETGVWPGNAGAGSCYIVVAESERNLQASSGDSNIGTGLAQLQVSSPYHR